MPFDAVTAGIEAAFFPGLTCDLVLAGGLVADREVVKASINVDPSLSPRGMSQFLRQRCRCVLMVVSDDHLLITGSLEVLVKLLPARSATLVVSGTLTAQDVSDVRSEKPLFLLKTPSGEQGRVNNFMPIRPCSKSAKFTKLFP